MQFLHKLYEKRPTSNSLEPRNDPENEEEEGLEPQVQVSDNVLNVPRLLVKNTSIKQKRKQNKNQNDIDLKILKLLEQQPCNKMSFLQSLMPHLQKFDDQDYLQFQMGVLKVIENINESKKKKTFYPPSNFAPYHQFAPQSQPLFLNSLNSTEYHPQQLFNAPNQSNDYLFQPYTTRNQQVLLRQQIPSCSNQPSPVAPLHKVTYSELEQNSPSLNSVESSISDSIDFSTSN